MVKSALSSLEAVSCFRRLYASWRNGNILCYDEYTRSHVLIVIIIIIIDYSTLVDSWKTSVNILITLSHYIVTVDYVGICIQRARRILRMLRYECSSFPSYNNNYSSQWFRNNQFPSNFRLTYCDLSIGTHKFISSFLPFRKVQWIKNTMLKACLNKASNTLQ